MSRLYWLSLLIALAGCSDTGRHPPRVQQAVAAAPAPVSTASSRDRAIVGAWLDERPYAGSRITFERDRDGLRVHRSFRDGSESDEKLERIPDSGGQRFREPDDSQPDEYYLVNANGDLEIRDGQGLITTARKAD